MTIHINRDALLDSLNFVQKAVAKQHPLPILDNVLIKAYDNGKVYLAGSDLSIYISTTCIPENVDTNESFTLPAHKFVSICKSLPADAGIQISQADGGKATIKSGRCKFVLATLPAADFPMLEDVVGNTFLVPAVNFRAMLEMCYKSMAKEDYRPFLNGIYVHTQNQDDILRIAGTDGHRLSYSQTGVVGIPSIASIIPYRAVLILLKNIPSNEDPIRLP